MSNVKPKAGQIWRSKSELDFEELPRGEFKIIEVNHSAILIKLLKFDYIITVDARTFNSGYEFYPVTDLEWLAVKVDLESFSFFVKYVSKGPNIPKFLKPGLEHLVIDGVFEGDEHYTRDQLQNMRYELGLDEKPTIHTELIGRICEGFPRPSEDISRLMSFRCISTSVFVKQKETEISTEKMIPINFSRNITPFVAGDVYYNDFLKLELTMDQQDADGFNNADPESEFNTYFVVSFADRPNTGTQPVGDDVVVGVKWTDASTGEMAWIADVFNSIKSWAPNYSAMLKQYQAEQEKNNLIEDVVNRLDEAIYLTSPQSSNVKIVINDDLKPLKTTIKFTTTDGAELEKQEDGTFICVKGGVSQGDLIIQKEDKPVYTQPMKDAGIMPPVGSMITYHVSPRDDEGTTVEVIGHYDDWIWVITELGNFDNITMDVAFSFPGTRTEEQKLAEELAAAMSDSVDDSLIGYANYLIRRYNITKKG